MAVIRIWYKNLDSASIQLDDVHKMMRFDYHFYISCLSGLFLQSQIFFKQIAHPDCVRFMFHLAEYAKQRFRT